MNDLLKINPKSESLKIIDFIKTTLKDQGKKNVVVGMSGGIDSVTAFYLLKNAIAPENIFAVYLPYFQSKINDFKNLLKNANLPAENIFNISIKNAVDKLKKILNMSDEDKVRLGNIMARIRMIILYDLARKNNALVCGTENKSEFYLGYFTRFGDEASDFEPIRHLYKTQVYRLAKYLNIPKKIIDLPPTAGLWMGQTDEADFGFSYKEADIVLNLYFDKKKLLSEIISKGFPNAKKITDWVSKNSFKHHLPYTP